jgi:hypothetical protein
VCVLPATPPRLLLCLCDAATHCHPFIRNLISFFCRILKHPIYSKFHLHYSIMGQNASTSKDSMDVLSQRAGSWAESNLSSMRAEEREKSSTPLSVSDHLTGRRVSIALVADGKLLSPQELRAQIKHPLELMQAAAWFFAQQLPGMKRHREAPPPPLGYMLANFFPCVPVRVMCGCVATACRRLTTAPAGMHVIYRTTGRWAGRIMERVWRGRVKRVQVRLQRRVCCAVRRACRSSDCVRCVFDACCRKRWPIFRCVAAHRSETDASSVPRRSFLCAGCCCRSRCRRTQMVRRALPKQHFGPRRIRMWRFGALSFDC